MNTERFRIFVEALEALPEEVKSRKVNMLSTTRPMKYTAGCFAGLVYIVANDITELHKLYTYQRYNYVMWSSTLDSFLGCNFKKWAHYNPKVWDNDFGEKVFSNRVAWGVEADGVITNNHIIVHLRKAYDRWVKLDNKAYISKLDKWLGVKQPLWIQAPLTVRQKIYKKLTRR
jgi:hypothetical protein